jgi:DNA polymerase IV (DinB-like DNA polymerase)
VSTSNYEARKLGIKAGIPISRAKKLAKDAIFLPVNMELYRSISDEVMEIMRMHCRTFEQESVDEAFCDITGMVPDYEEATSFAVKIKKEIRKKVGLTCSVGVAPNKLVAKIASDFRKPDGLTVVKPDEIQKFLAPLKITDITGVGKKTGERLNELGIRTIGELSMVSAEELTREFGQARGMWLKQASRGIDDSPVIEREGTEQIGRITTLKEDTKDLNIIFSAIDELSEDVYRKLVERKLGFKSISFVAITSVFKTHSKTHTLSAPAKDLITIRTEARQLARAFLTENPAALRRVGVKAANLMEEKGQRTLGEF